MTMQKYPKKQASQEGVPKHVQVGIEYGLIRLGQDFDEYLTNAAFDPSGFECAVGHGQQGAGKSNYMLQRLYAIKKASLFREQKGMPEERQIWDAVLDAIVFTPTDFIEKLEQVQDSDERLDVVLWDDIQLEYTSSSFKTNVDQYSAIDSMMAVIRTKCAITLITIPNITRLPKNVKDNVTFEVFVGKNRKVQIRKIFRLPGQRRIDSNLFKPIIQAPKIFDLYAIPPWAWKKYEKMRQDIANKALANLKEVTDMGDGTGYISMMDARNVCRDNKVNWSMSTLQQHVSRGVLLGKKVKGMLYVDKEHFYKVLSSETGKDIQVV